MKRVTNFAKCHEPDLDLAASFTLEKLSENTEVISTLNLVITLTNQPIPKTEKLEPCFDLTDPNSAHTISTMIPIVSVYNIFIGDCYLFIF